MSGSSKNAREVVFLAVCSDRLRLAQLWGRCSWTTLSTLLSPSSGQPRNFGLFWRWMHQVPSKGWYPYTSLHGVLFLKTVGVVSSAFGTSIISNNYLCNTHVYLTLREHFNFVRTETLRENSWYLAYTPFGCDFCSILQVKFCLLIVKPAAFRSAF
jgi:hypothetical protein